MLASHNGYHNLSATGRKPQDVSRLAIVQQQHVQVRIRQQLAAAEPADPDDCKTTGIGDPDLVGLVDQPRLMQIQPRLPQPDRIQLAMVAGQQLASGDS